MPIIIFLIAIGGIYGYQQTLSLGNDELDVVEGTFQKINLWQDKKLPLRIHLKEYNDIFVIDRGLYNSWSKKNNFKNIKKESTLKLAIESEKAYLLRNRKVNLINVIIIQSENKTYLALNDYNEYKRSSLFKLYLAAIVLFVLFNLIRLIQKKIIRT